MELKIGDLVKLKSGGPTMTVTQLIEQSEHVECSWFVGPGSDKVNDAPFLPDALKAVEK